MILKPEEDGITHINVYSQGKTELGKLLSNFAHTPFRYQFYDFQSVEAWWYWIQMVMLFDRKQSSFKHIDIKKIRGLHGYEAKKWGKFYLGDDRYDITPEDLKSVYMEKLFCNPNIFMMLMKNELPLEHYYVYGNIVRPADKYLWTVKLWEEIKEELKEKINVL